MGYELEVIETPKYIIVKLSGTLDKEVSFRMVDEVIAVFQASNHYKMLLDTRQLQLATSLIQDHSQASYAATLLVGKKHLIAHLTLEGKLDADLFFETVGVNRGMNIRTFTEEQDAINWLIK
jgi:hypothetical protein